MHVDNPGNTDRIRVNRKFGREAYFFLSLYPVFFSIYKILCISSSEKNLDLVVLAVEHLGLIVRYTVC